MDEMYWRELSCHLLFPRPMIKPRLRDRGLIYSISI
jgi:hypothetical protein